jgi:prepilin-type N-terminal cleavage/methylation domain-containing protein/prepilin-type processing-associated H-X9-DG protein
MSHQVSQSHRRSGFTLVELLVVIGIIAVLIGILLPTLGNARRQANRIVCLSNQRQLASALFIYATENKGAIPPSPNWENASLTWKAYYDPAIFGVRTEPECKDNWWGLGYLFVMRTIKDPKTFYCPDMIHPVFTYPTGWESPEKVSLSLQGIKILGYLYRVFGQQSAGLTAQDVQEVRNLKLGKMKNKALSMDIIVQSNYAGGTWPHKKPNGVNAAYSDGHAEFVEVSAKDLKSALKFYTVHQSDNYVFLFFKALDTKDFTALRLKFP